MFAGIGGFRQGSEGFGGRCAFTSECDRYSKKTYLANFACDHEFVDDISTLTVAGIPGHELLLASFPCQRFATANHSTKNASNRGQRFTDEARGTAFFTVAQIIGHYRPKAFLIETGKDLINHDRGPTFEVIHRTLTAELGYQAHWKIINSKGFVPQQRERIFIVGSREANDFVFDDLDLPKSIDGPQLHTILHPEDGSEEVDAPYSR